MSLDYAESYRLFKLSAEQGYPSTQYNLAALTESGEGTTADLEQAHNCYRKAAEQGNELAQERIDQLESQPPKASETANAKASGAIHDQAWIKTSQPRITPSKSILVITKKV